MTSTRRIIIGGVVLLALTALVLFWWAGRGARSPAPGLAGISKIENRESKIQNLPPPSPAASTADSTANPIVETLNAPDGTIARDLKIVDELFVAFHTNFPRLGNPVGENADIAAALQGENPAKFAFFPRTHRALNARGELCDRWGTPFRFHQLSGTQMEVRSAGPDRKFGTADDAVLTP